MKARFRIQFPEVLEGTCFSVAAPVIVGDVYCILAIHFKFSTSTAANLFNKRRRAGNSEHAG